MTFDGFPVGLAAKCAGVISIPRCSRALREVQGNHDLYGQTLFEELGPDAAEKSCIGLPVDSVLGALRRQKTSPAPRAEVGREVGRSAVPDRELELSSGRAYDHSIRAIGNVRMVRTRQRELSRHHITARFKIHASSEVDSGTAGRPLCLGHEAHHSPRFISPFMRRSIASAISSSRRVGPEQPVVDRRVQHRPEQSVDLRHGVGVQPRLRQSAVPRSNRRRCDLA